VDGCNKILRIKLCIVRNVDMKDCPKMVSELQEEGDSRDGDVQCVVL
jgi:hypothetical protein